MKFYFVDTETKGFGDLQKILVLEDEKDFLKKELEKLHETYSECYNKCAVMAKDKADLKSEIEKLESKVKDLISGNESLRIHNKNLTIGYNNFIDKMEPHQKSQKWRSLFGY